MDEHISADAAACSRKNISASEAEGERISNFFFCLRLESTKAVNKFSHDSVR